MTFPVFIKQSPTKQDFLNNTIIQGLKNLVQFLLGISILVAVSFSCSESATGYRQVEIIATYDLSVPEPSGLSFGKNYETLWVVSDSPDNSIYQISLTGTLIQKLSIKGDDFEGIAYDHQNDLLWVADEKNCSITKMTTQGVVLSVAEFNISQIPNYGLEGIGLADSGYYWMAHEKEPGAIFKVNKENSIVDQLTIKNLKDYSGLFFDNDSGKLWIVSDESRLLVSFDTKTKDIVKYSIPIEKAEGVTLNPLDNTFFIVSDSQAKLYHLKL